MRRINYLGFAAAAISALAIGCGPETNNGDVTNNDATTDAGAAQTYTFVLDQLQIDADDLPENPHTGFNLDDLFSTESDPLGCAHPDFYSLYDNDQHCTAVSNERCTVMPNPGCARGTGCSGGVDNQLPTLANTINTVMSGTDIRATLADTVTNNKLALIVRVSGVNDLTNDSSVRVAIYRGFPTFTAGCTSVTGGREYSVDRSFLSAGATDIDTGANVAFDGAIVNGRLQVRAGTATGGVFNLPLSFSGFNIVLPLHQLQVRANITATGLANGSLGGWVGGSDVVDAVAMIAPDYVAVVRGVIAGLVDIQINMSCGDSSANPPTYGGIAVGLGLRAVPATISTTTPIADMQAAGTCGYSAPGDGG